jgi:hypothetical protein
VGDDRRRPGSEVLVGTSVFPVGLVAMAALVGLCFPLKMTDRERVALAKRSGAIQFVVAVAAILTIGWFLSHK